MIQTLSLAEIGTLARDVLTRAGVPGRYATPVAAEVVAAEAAEDRAAGLVALLRDLRLLRYGHILAKPQMAFLPVKPGCLMVDAGHGFAAAALTQALPTLADMTRTQGVVALSLRRASAPGPLRHTRHAIADLGLACLLVDSNAAGPAVPPADDDDPFGGPVAHCALLVVADPDLPLRAPDRVALPDPEASMRVPVPDDLLQQIVGA